jgi:hypothetical protein
MAQFLYSDDGQPLFAVITYEQFKMVSHLLSNNAPPQMQQTLVSQKKSDLLSADGSSITLPHGGGNQLCIADLVEYFLSNCIVKLAINQRAQRFDVYPDNQKSTLDPLIRWNCLKNTPYLNTMQSVQSFIDALVSTGIFKRTTHFFPMFKRSVNAIEIIPSEAELHLQKYQVKAKWTNPPYSDFIHS